MSIIKTAAAAAPMDYFKPGSACSGACDQGRADCPHPMLCRANLDAAAFADMLAEIEHDTKPATLDDLRGLPPTGSRNEASATGNSSICDRLRNRSGTGFIALDDRARDLMLEAANLIDKLRARLGEIEAQEPAMYVLRSTIGRPAPWVVKHRQYLSVSASDLVGSGMDHLDPLYVRHVPAIPAGWKLAAWGSDDGRVIPAATMETALRDGGGDAEQCQGIQYPSICSTGVQGMSAIDEIMREVSSLGDVRIMATRGRADRDDVNAQADEVSRMITAALAEARREGAEAMRDAVESLREDADEIFPPTGRGRQSPVEARDVVEWYSESIRALPLPTGERQAVRLTDEQIVAAYRQPLDGLMDHIYENGTAAEGDEYHARKIARAIETAVLKANGLGEEK